MTATLLAAASRHGTVMAHDIHTAVAACSGDLPNRELVQGL